MEVLQRKKSKVNITINNITDRYSGVSSVCVIKNKKSNLTESSSSECDWQNYNNIKKSDGSVVFENYSTGLSNGSGSSIYIYVFIKDNAGNISMKNQKYTVWYDDSNDYYYSPSSSSSSSSSGSSSGSNSSGSSCDVDCQWVQAQKDWAACSTSSCRDEAHNRVEKAVEDKYNATFNPNTGCYDLNDGSGSISGPTKT